MTGKAYGLKFGYGLEHHWLPGSVDVGLSFDGLGDEDMDFGGLGLAFRSSPGRWIGGMLATSAGIDGDADLSAGFSWRGDFRCRDRSAGCAPQAVAGADFRSAAFPAARSLHRKRYPVSELNPLDGRTHRFQRRP